MSEPRESAKREAVRRALEDAHGFISAGRLHLLINAEGTSIGLATVYRQLNALAESGYADTIAHPSGQLFRACRKPGAHHHHLVCETCGSAADIDPPDEAWIHETAARHGFTVTRHVLDVFGTCTSCATA